MSVIVYQPLARESQLQKGLSYWRVKLVSGKEFSELDQSFDLVRGTRPLQWLEDIIGSGDNARIAEVALCTPVGDSVLTISEPCTAFQLHRSTHTMMLDERIHNAQIIGRLEDRETGRCSAYIWDVQEQKLYGEWQTYVGMPGYPGFGAWREGVIPLGNLNLIHFQQN